MNRAFRHILKVAGASVVAVLPALVAAAPAHASGGTPLSTTPAANTPFVTSTDATVTQIVQCGSTMYAVGSFSQVGVPAGTRYTRNNAFSFSATTGAVSSWDPDVNGEVSGIQLSASCKTAYLGGEFTSVHGTSVTNLAAVSTSTGSVASSFRPQPNKKVFTLARYGSELIVGGEFTTIGGGSRAALASVSGTSGALTSYTNLGITGVISSKSGLTRVLKLRPNPAGTQMLVMGNFTGVGKYHRKQVFMVNTTSTSTALMGWYVPDFNLSCIASEPVYVQAGTWSTGGTRVYFATTGDHGSSPLCDTISAFYSSTGAHSPIWSNATGCDSLFSVAYDSQAVYAGGHERWANNEHGCDKAGTGSVERKGITAVAAGGGRAVAWNPSHSRGHGADDMLRTSTGLWVASDTYFDATTCGGVYHPGICFFPND